MSVGEDEKFKKFKKFNPRKLRLEALKHTGQLLLTVEDERLVDGHAGRQLLLDPGTLVKVRLIRLFEVLGHRTEGSASEVELELFVEVLLALLGALGVR